MHELYELKDKLMNELEAYNENGKFSKDDAEAIKALSASIEHICNIMNDEDGYSSRSYADGMGGSLARSGRGGYSREGGSYRGSYARGRGGRGRSYYSGAESNEDIETIKTEARKLVEKLEQM